MKSHSYGEWLVTEFTSADGSALQLVKNTVSGSQFERPITERSISSEAWIRLIQQAEMSLQKPTQAYVRWGVRVLAMVAELHKLGFQRLRIVPYMAPSGMYWRCGITTVDNILTTHGAMHADHRMEASYTSGMENKYFDWSDALKDSARELAAKFMIRFPELVERGRGQDWEYVGWFQYMLGFAERGDVPVSFDDYNSPNDHSRLQTVGLSNGTVTLDMPPDGEASS